MILFVNHHEKRCGVYQMGARIGRELEQRLEELVYCEGREPCLEAARKGPRIVVHNWHPSTEPWAPEIKACAAHAKHVGLMHEIASSTSSAGADLFNYRVVCDPTFPEDGRTTFRAVRHVPRFERTFNARPRFTVGSFGFAVGGKLFHHVASLVAKEFPGAELRLHIARARFGDDAGTMAASYARDCATSGNGLQVTVTHEFLAEEALVEWLAENDLNIFFYEENRGRGVSSVIDYALAAQRPIAVNGSEMFRHVRRELSCYPDRNLWQLFQNESAVRRIYREWSPEQLVADFQRVFRALSHT